MAELAHSYLALLLSAATVALARPWVAVLATHYGMVDRPGPRRVHDRPIPRTGGLALAGPVLVGLWVIEPMYAVAGGLLLLYGVADDMHPLPAILKLAVQTLIVLTVTQDPLDAFWLLCLINAWNLVDGVDGVAVSLGAVGLLGIITVAGPDVWPFWLIWGALLGYLVVVGFPAKLFLGDGGAYLIGGMMGLLTLNLTWPQRVAFCIVPLADLVWTLLRRRLHPFRPDRQHIHHRLLDAGLPPWRVSLTLSGFGMLCVGIGILL